MSSTSRQHDIVIRGGTVYDGTGAAPFAADIAIDNGVITAVGKVSGSGAEEIDAKGQIVTPGFIDVHTHYDGQVTWDPYLQPSTFHGVTTAVMGNCGVGFAPCKPEQREWLLGLMEGVEDIPGTALAEGIKWNWESFAEYMDAVAASPLAVDVGLQIPHAAVRAYVMGERAPALEPATEAETEEMARLVVEALEAGALGFSTSRTVKHKDVKGGSTPTLKAEAQELHGIARAMGKSGKGVLQLIADFKDTDAEFAMLRGMVELSGRPMSITIEQDDRWPDVWARVLDNIAAANADGLPIKGQVPPRATGLLLGLTASLNPFVMHQTFRHIWGAPLETQLKALRDPEFRAKLLAEEPEYPAGEIIEMICVGYHKMFALGERPDYEPAPEQSAKAVAERTGKNPREVVLDWMLERDGKALLYFPLMNYHCGSLADVEKMLTHPNTAFGLSDGGAHCGIICDVSFPTTLLTHWGRDRTRGAKLPLEWLVHGLTGRNADLVGLHDRGILAPGMKADVNVIDFDRLTLYSPHIVNDLPAGGKRLIQKTDGYTASIVSGAVAFRNGEPTGALGGRLIRGAQTRPAGARIAAD
ncbi:amidohydrolase family protein [Parvibaculum sp.]|uniref:N-acyl-D-amino-acid deacylase family protein n=1 Tax=Parvibaculum sp. TaxID=2024848 RepID=UPI001D38E0D6|nr:amidohydrolase family protein [Parvibaculum sp.]MBX3490392.1 amidohydrolase family protein [Parvibaculum sp.]MCW5728249.1 amidohydrolase family protein [Parvibaculum sp.]